MKMLLLVWYRGVVLGGLAVVAESKRGHGECRRTEHHVGWVEGQVVELAEWREVVDGLLAGDVGGDGADPADGSGDYTGL